jgi:hypothetical protein
VPASGAPGQTLGEPTQMTGIGTETTASPPHQASSCTQNQQRQRTRTTDDHGQATGSSGAISKSIRQLRKEHPRMSGRTVLSASSDSPSQDTRNGQESPSHEDDNEADDEDDEDDDDKEIHIDDRLLSQLITALQRLSKGNSEDGAARVPRTGRTRQQKSRVNEELQREKANDQHDDRKAFLVSLTEI